MMPKESANILDNFNSVGLRRMFYLVTPNETSFADVGDVPKYVDEATPMFLLFALIELLVLRIENKKIPLNDAFTSLAGGMFQQVIQVLVRSIHIMSYLVTFNYYHVYDLSWNSTSIWLIGFVGVDFLYYWFHRMGHEVNFMWAAHQMHHSSQEYNLTTALRQSVVQGFTSFVFYLPMALLGVPPSVFAVHQYFNLLYQFWIHTEIIRSLGPFEYILNTPSHHRVHHGRNPYCIDKNYGGTLIIWDRMFGTFACERDDQKIAFGLVHNVNSFDPIFLQFGSYHYIFTDKINSVSGVANMLRAVVYGPGWEPGKPRMGLIEDIPEPESPVQKYDPPSPPWLHTYVGVHHMIAFFAYLELSNGREVLSSWVMFEYVAFIMATLYCVGALYDNKHYAGFLELARCSSVLVFYLSQGIEVLSKLDERLVVVVVMAFSCSIFIVNFAYSFSDSKINNAKRD